MNYILLSSGESTGGGSGWLGTLGTLAYFALIIGLFWFLLIRPQKKRQKQEDELRNSVSVGDVVVMTSGIVGKIICIKDDEVTIENGLSRTQLTFMKAAITQVKVKNGETEQSVGQSVDEKKAELQRKLDEKNAAKKAEKEAAKNASTDDKIDLK